jgi:hypothetical protein
MMIIGILTFVPSGIALGMLINGQHPGTFGSASSICYGIGVVLIVIGSRMQFREIARYRVRTGTESFNPYLHKGRIP